jgi:hypothetical protein
MGLAFTHAGALYIVLDEENVERIQQNDPFDFHQRSALGMSLALSIPLTVVVAYARKDEHAKIAAMPTTAEAVAYLRRGYRETASDHERSVTALRPKGRDS